MNLKVLWYGLGSWGLSWVMVSGGPTALGIRYERVLGHAEARSRVLAETVLQGNRERFVNYTTSSGTWRTQSDSTWTSGFVPGSFWYLHALGLEDWREQAMYWAEGVRSRATSTDNDTGLQVYPAFGLGLLLDAEGTEAYADVMIQGATTLVEQRYHPVIGSFRSWPERASTITELPFEVNIDQMMNMELVLWAGMNGGPAAYVDYAVQHADTTWEHLVREDGGTFHVVAYNLDGTVDYKRTHQGWNADSTWSRGQAWAAYGYAMFYRYTGLPRMLERSRKCYAYFKEQTLADAGDFVPYSDFDAPLDHRNPRDTSAAAIVACAALQLHEITGEAAYRADAEAILESLSSPRYLSRGTRFQSILMKASEKWGEPEVGAIFADYYFLEAIWRWALLEDEPAEVTGGWAVYDILDGRFTDTGSFMGWMDVQHAPFIYNYTLEGWFYTPAGAVTTEGGWLYTYRP